jgi:hypothetical protein
MLCNLKELMAKKSKTLSAPIELEVQSTSPIGPIDFTPTKLEAIYDQLEAQSTTTDLYVPIVKPMRKVKTVKTGVGYEILTLIAQGELSNKEIVEMVLAANPLRKTTYACVAWYKSQVAAGKIDLPKVEPIEETGNPEEFDEEGNFAV